MLKYYVNIFIILLPNNLTSFYYYEGIKITFASLNS